MKCVILQPSYIPWRGYFDQISQADLFVFYDDVQYDKNGWRNRNRIKTAQGLQWLTIPVHTKGSVEDGIPINQIKISWEKPWNKHHWRGIQFAYKKAPFFDKYGEYFANLFEEEPEFLADFTIKSTIEISRLLGIAKTQFMRSSEMEDIKGTKTDRLISILKSVGADHYISGPSAKDYIEPEKFNKAGISLEYIVYDYPAYDQLHPPYEPAVSIIDLLFMQGNNAINFFKKH
jgi:hypothetical protein